MPWKCERPPQLRTSPAECPMNADGVIDVQSKTAECHAPVLGVAFKNKAYFLADGPPGLAAAEHAAERAALHLQRIGALHRDRRVVIAAAVRIVNPAGPFRAQRLHVDQNLFAAL